MGNSRTGQDRRRAMQKKKSDVLARLADAVRPVPKPRNKDRAQQHAATRKEDPVVAAAVEDQAALNSLRRMFKKVGVWSYNAAVTVCDHLVPEDGKPADNGLAQIQREAERLQQRLDAQGQVDKKGEPLFKWKVWDEPGHACEAYPSGKVLLKKMVVLKTEETMAKVGDAILDVLGLGPSHKGKKVSDGVEARRHARQLKTFRDAPAAQRFVGLATTLFSLAPNSYDLDHPLTPRATPISPTRHLGIWRRSQAEPHVTSETKTPAARDFLEVFRPLILPPIVTNMWYSSRPLLLRAIEMWVYRRNTHAKLYASHPLADLGPLYTTVALKVGPSDWPHQDWTDDRFIPTFVGVLGKLVTTCELIISALDYRVTLFPGEGVFGYFTLWIHYNLPMPYRLYRDRPTYILFADHNMGFRPGERHVGSDEFLGEAFVLDKDSEEARIIYGDQTAGPFAILAALDRVWARKHAGVGARPGFWSAHFNAHPRWLERTEAA